MMRIVFLTLRILPLPILHYVNFIKNQFKKKTDIPRFNQKSVCFLKKIFFCCVLIKKSQILFGFSLYYCFFS